MIAPERVPKRFARMLNEMECSIYEERLDKLGLFPLKWRRLMGNLIDIKL